MAAVFQTQLKLLILMIVMIEPVINESGTGKDLATFHLLSYYLFISFLSFFSFFFIQVISFHLFSSKDILFRFFYKLARHYTIIQRVG